MSTTESNIYDAVKLICTTNLAADYQTIPDPYFVETNAITLLDKGFGIQSNEGENTNRYVNNCLVTWKRNYTIILTKQIASTQNDVSARETIDKDLRLDVALLWKKFELDPTLGASVILCRVLGDTGIQGLDVSGVKFLTVAIFLEVEYQEDPNS